MRVATAKQLQAYDSALVAVGYPMETLVEMASDCLLPHCQGYEDVVIFCGNGNNGSDGFSLALKLFAQGKSVQVVLVSDSQRRGALNNDLLQAVFQKNIPLLDIGHPIPEGALVVDAMLGFGFRGHPRPNTLQAIDTINRYLGDVLSVDIPSGLHCDGFTPAAPMAVATKTLSFVAMKQSFLNPDSGRFLGALVIAPLPVNDPVVTPPLATLFTRELAQATLKPRAYDTYKGREGHGLLRTGGQYLGAGLLTTKACVYSGCGLTTWWGAAELSQTMVSHTPELIATATPTAQGKTAMLVGSGLGLSLESEKSVRWALAETKLPLVIDGDGLTILARNPDLLAMARGRAILTPHMGEFQRFAPQGDDPIEQAFAFARTHGVVLALKGPATIITDGQVMYRNTTGNRRMATAGSGDVLAGLVVGLLARGYTLLEAANLAVYLHGAAGDAVAKTHHTAIPSLVVEEIPKVMRQLEQTQKKM